MEFAVLTYANHRNKRGDLKDEYFLLDIGSTDSTASPPTTVYKREPHGPNPREGGVLEPIWSSLWVNTQSTPLDERRLWYPANRRVRNLQTGEYDDEWLGYEVQDQLKAWGFVPVHEALENGQQ